ncbi:MAG: 30S ribosomal protein S16 [Chitinivibrionales bacterium]|nr:30S ribosomal protein S16 [Chitinivibrionales bacterium]
MAVKIRLARQGRKGLVRYRIVAADSAMKRDGRFLETLGTYNPEASPKEFELKTNRISYWVKQGAQPTATVRSLLKQDHFYDKMEALERGLEPDTLNLERKPERKRKPKNRNKKNASE